MNEVRSFARCRVKQRVVWNFDLDLGWAWRRSLPRSGERNVSGGAGGKLSPEPAANGRGADGCGVDRCAR